MKKDWTTISVILLCILFALSHIPFLSVIPTNNANVYYDAVHAVLHNNVNPFILFEGYKPPLLFLLTASLFRLFQPSIIIGGVIIALSASLALWFTYKLGTVLFHKKAGIMAAFTLCVFPLFLSHSFQFTDAMFVTPMLLAAMYYFYKHNKIGYLISMTLAVLTRETSVFIPLLLTGIELFHTKKLKQLLTKLVIIVLPLIPFIVWMGINKNVFGWFLWPDNIKYFSFRFDTFIQQVGPHAKVALFDCGAIVFLTCITLFIVLKLTKRIKTTWEQQHATILFLLFAGINFCIVTNGPFHPRYMFSTYPFLSVLAVGSLFMSMKPKIATILTTIMIATFIIYQTLLYMLPLRYWGESDLSQLRMASTFSKSFTFIHKEYPNALITMIPRIYRYSDAAFGKTIGSVEYNTYTWNDTIASQDELKVVCDIATKASLSPVIFIHESEVGDPVDELSDKQLIGKITVDDNNLRYHLLFQLNCPTMNTQL